ncbi:MAG TPA: VWA domain-containing protein [Thermoanaerobaculia bacterium]|nr:VWA domain-containing protein [Thermoanaerobaculia bacterium]
MAEALGVTFAEGPLLWLALATPVALLLLVAAERRRTHIARRFVSERLRGVANPARPLRPWLLGVAIVAAVVALAGPRRGVTVVPVETRELNRVIVVDVSLSMAAEDVGTSRLDAAKAIAKRIVEAHSGRTGLVVFENGADVVSPLTSDGDAVAALVDSLQPGEVSLPGSDVAAGLGAALKLLDADPRQRGDIVVIGDGEDQVGRAADAVQKLRARGIPVSTIAVGTTRGSTIRNPEGAGYLRDDSGQIVTTFAHPDALEVIAQQTGGRFFDNPFGEHALDALAASGGGATRKKNVEIPIDRYQWPLGAAFALLMLGSLANRGAE